VYTVEVVDLALPGPLPLVVARSYSSATRDLDVGLGPGWTHSLAWLIEERRSTIRVVEPGAAPTVAPRLSPGSSLLLPCGRLTRYPWGYALDQRGITRIFEVRRGRSWLLSRAHDVNHNLIQLTYEGGILRELTDSAGRQILVKRRPDGHITSFEVQSPVDHARSASFRTYEYDERRDLVAAVDAEGHAQRFEYDGDHQLVRRREPGGLTAEFVYDRAGRCVESWCHREGRDGLDEEAPAVLADGHTRAKGFMHVKILYAKGYSEVVNSRAIRRMDGNELDKTDRSVWSGGVHTFGYDEAGNVVEYGDALGNLWQTARDAMGQVRSTTDPLGGTTKIARDARGDVIAVTSALGSTVGYARDERGRLLSIRDELGVVASFEYDERGLVVAATLPNGGVTRMGYDGHGNRTRIVEPDGATRQIRYDFFGRVQSFTDARGHETHYAYDPCGRLRSVRTPSGATTVVEYDVDGNRMRTISPDGRAITLRWGGLHVVTEVQRADGHVVRYRYDREQDLVRIVDEIGQEHRFVRRGEGRIVEERTFDGRSIRYRHDDAGRVVQEQEGTRTVEYAYDPAGRLIERAYSDDRKDVLGYDAVGRLVSLQTDDAVCSFTYDARGGIVRESVRHGGRETVSVWERDAMGKAVRVTDAAGTLGVRRDVVGRPIELHQGAGAPIQFRYDRAGCEIERALPGGGRVVMDRSVDGGVTRLAVTGTSVAPEVGPGEPAWIGRIPTAETTLRAYTRSPAGRVLAVEDLAGTRKELVRDANGRVTEHRTLGGASVVFGYDPSGDLHEPGVPRRHAPGGRLVERGSSVYRHDEHGRVVEKRERSPEGERVWDYQWRDDHRLASVRAPDGAMISFAYDGFARRLEKRVEREGRTESVTRYAWRGDVLVHEIRERAQESGDPIVEERSYLVSPGSLLPLAHRESRDGATGASVYYVRSPLGAPEALVEDTGDVIAELDLTVLGRLAGPEASLTPLRLPGQYADEETGLCYNRHRYYDPETGHFLSPEPLGLAASLKAYAYADFHGPELVDVDGLAVQSAVFGPEDSEGVTPVLGTGKSGGDPDDLHPAVKAALPPTEDLAPNRSTDSRGKCAEPAAMSDHLYGWEAANPPNKCNPPDPNWQKNLGSAMNQIDPNGGIASGTKKGGLPACENCGQMVARLYALSGQTPPSGVIVPGTAGGITAPMMNPTDAQLNNPANAAQNGGPWPGGPATLGTYTHDGTTLTAVQPPT
jgi:RHS repeat-associated protein